LEDPRVSSDPFVVGEFGLRFFAAAPLRARDGRGLRTLSIVEDSILQSSFDIHNRPRRTCDEIDELILHAERHSDRLPPITDEAVHSFIVREQFICGFQNPFQIGELADSVLVHRHLLIDGLQPATT
jgi:hypothetical protein